MENKKINSAKGIVLNSLASATLVGATIIGVGLYGYGYSEGRKSAEPVKIEVVRHVSGESRLGFYDNAGVTDASGKYTNMLVYRPKSLETISPINRDVIESTIFEKIDSQ